MRAADRRGVPISNVVYDRPKPNGNSGSARVEVIAAMRARLLVVEHRQLTDGARDRHRQLAARIRVAEQDVGHRGAAFLTEIPAFEQRVRLRGDLRNRQRLAVDQHDDDGLAAARTWRRASSFCSPIRSSVGAVAEMIVGPGFATRRAAAADHEHDRVGALCDLHRFLDALAILFRVGEHDFVFVPVALVGQAHAFGASRRARARRASLLMPSSTLMTCVGTFEYPPSSMRAAFGPMTASVLSRSRAQRQHAIVLQQHDGLARSFERERAGFGVVGDGLGVLRVRVGLFEQAGQELQPQHAAHGGVDLGLRDRVLAARALRQQGIRRRHPADRSRRLPSARGPAALTRIGGRRDARRSVPRCAK